MVEGTLCSERLGRIRDEQFEAALSRFGLGRFVRAAAITHGLFGQNVFVTSSGGGEFVLRGAPHWTPKKRADSVLEYERNDGWQFAKEKFFAEELHHQTGAPVPWPMHYDEASDVFGWPYLLMPRMPGTCFEERAILTALDAKDRRAVAIALGEMLAQMQRLRWPFAGEIDTDVVLKPYPAGDMGHILGQTALQVYRARDNGAFDDADQDFVDWAGATARAAADRTRPHTFVHGDYKLNNLTLMEGGDRWRVSGIFDLHEARFGDGALDLVRQTCSYLDTEPALAPVFVESYLSRTPADPTLAARMHLYIINDRIKFWAYFTQAPKRAWWTEGHTFRSWTQRYLDGVLALL